MLISQGLSYTTTSIPFSCHLRIAWAISSPFILSIQHHSRLPPTTSTPRPDTSTCSVCSIFTPFGALRPLLPYTRLSSDEAFARGCSEPLPLLIQPQQGLLVFLPFDMHPFGIHQRLLMGNWNAFMIQHVSSIGKWYYFPALV